MKHTATTIGLDIAKHSFYAVGVDRNRREVLRRKLTCAQVLRFFRAGRIFALNLGLTPREFSTGGKQRLFGISKRGDRYLRTLLIHGARSVLRRAEGKPDRLLQWALRLKDTKGFNVAACALANKLARVAWALVAHGRRYQPQGLTLAEAASHE
jgi:transposase